MTARRKPASMAPIPVGVQKLAAQLARRMPWLARGRHIGALVRVLHRHQLDADAGWSAERLLNALELHNRATGRLVPDPAKQRNPLGYLNALIGAAAPTLPPREQDSLRANRAVRRVLQEQIKERAPLSAADRSARAEIIAQIRVDIERNRQAARSAPRDVGRRADDGVR